MDPHLILHGVYTNWLSIAMHHILRPNDKIFPTRSQQCTRTCVATTVSRRYKYQVVIRHIVLALWWNYLFEELSTFVALTIASLSIFINWLIVKRMSFPTYKICQHWDILHKINDASFITVLSQNMRYQAKGIPYGCCSLTVSLRRWALKQGSLIHSYIITLNKYIIP